MKIANFEIGIDKSFFVIAGPCVIESEKLALETAEFLKKTTQELNINLVYKTSFDKANRTSSKSFRGLGLSKGLAILQKIKDDIGVPVLTDVHEDTPLDEVASVVDVLQTPALLARQTNFIQNVCRQKKPVNIKKGQFQAPTDMQHVVAKAYEVGNHNIMLCERGVSFGYNTLISDMRSLVIMRKTNCPIIFDATHSVQQPGGLGATSGGQRMFVPALARSAIAVGVSGIFMETHPNPAEALSDGANMLPIDKIPSLLSQLKEIDYIVKNNTLLENILN